MYQLRSLLNNLKRRYKLELIKAEQGRVSDWVLYNAMHFLKPYIRIGQSSTASTAYQDTFNIGEDEEDDEEPNSPIANASTSGERVKCSPEPQSFDVKDFQLTVPCDREQMMGNYVAMHMRDLPPERAMEVSVEIIKVLSTFMKYRIHK